MPGVNYGQISGASGPIAVAVINTAPASAVIVQVSELVGWESSTTSQLKPRRGRGGTSWPAYRRIFNSGSVAGSGKVSVEGVPFDPDAGGHTGSIVFQMDGLPSKTVTYPVTFTAVSVRQNAKTQDTWEITFSAVQTGAPSFSSDWGTAPNATDPSASDLQLYDGTQFTIDNDALLTSSVVVIDWWGSVTDSNAGDTDKLATIIAAAVVPYTNLKLRTGTLVRDAGDGGIGGGTISLSWGLTTPAEDIINGATSTTIDPDGLQSSAASAGIDNAPVDPVGDNFKLRAFSERELNDQKTLTVNQYGLTTTSEDVINSSTATTVDPDGIASSASAAGINSTPDTPSEAAFKVRETTTRELNDTNELTVVNYGLTTHAEDMINSATSETIDPAGLQSQASAAAINADPDTPTGDSFKLRTTTTREINDDNDLHISSFGLTTTDEDVINGSTSTHIDPDGLTSSASAAALNSTPVTPTSAAFKVRGTTSREINDANDLNVVEYGLTTHAEDIINGSTSTTLDSSGIASSASVAALNSTPVTPTTAAFKVRETTTRELNDDNDLNVVHYGLTTRDEDMENDASSASIDPDGIESHVRTASVNGTPMTPLAPSGNSFKERATITRVINDATEFTVKDWGLTTSGEDMVNGQSYETTDVSGLSDSAVTASLDGSPPSPVNTDLAEYETTVREVNDQVDLTVTRWAHLTKAEEIEFHGTSATADILGNQAIDGTITEQTSVKTCEESETEDSILAGEVDTLNGESIPWFRATVEKINKTHYLLRVQRPSDDKKLHETGSYTRREERRVDPSGAYLKVGDVLPDDGETSYRWNIATWTIPVQRVGLVLRRYYKTSTATTNRFDTMASTRNLTAFLGYDAGTVHYKGWNQVFAWGDEEANTRWIAVDYEFEVCRTRMLDILTLTNKTYDADYECPAVHVGSWVQTADKPGPNYLMSSVNPNWVVSTDLDAEYSVFLT